MFRLRYDQLTDKRKKTYKKSYINALEKNDLPTVIHLTNLGTPIPDWNGPENSIIDCLFFLQEDSYVLERVPLIIYLYEHGIHNPIHEGNEKELILYYSLKECHMPLIEHFLSSFNYPHDHWIMPYCLHILSNLEDKGDNTLANKWTAQNLPTSLSRGATLIHAFTSRSPNLFIKNFPLEDKLAFIEAVLPEKDFYYSLTTKPDPRQAVMGEMTLSWIQENKAWDIVLDLINHTIENRPLANLVQIKNFILHDKLTANVPINPKGWNLNKI